MVGVETRALRNPRRTTLNLEPETLNAKIQVPAPNPPQSTHTQRHAHKLRMEKPPHTICKAPQTPTDGHVSSAIVSCGNAKILPGERLQRPKCRLMQGPEVRLRTYCSVWASFKALSLSFIHGFGLRVRNNDSHSFFRRIFGDYSMESTMDPLPCDLAANTLSTQLRGETVVRRLRKPFLCCFWATQTEHGCLYSRL